MGFLYSLIGVGIAHPIFSELFRNNYGYSLSCISCHDYSLGLNSFGSGFKKKDFSFKALEKTDSDNDGYINLEEFINKSNPGDINSTPINPGKLETNLDATKFYSRFIKNRLKVKEFKLYEKNGFYYFKGEKSGHVGDIFISTHYIFLGLYAVYNGSIYIEPQYTKGVKFKRKFVKDIDEIELFELRKFLDAKANKN
ncbi:MAG: hypothetical protein NZ870_00270 [bacterium]|nr:hypothetical protein [bacterium]